MPDFFPPFAKSACNPSSHRNAVKRDKHNIRTVGDYPQTIQLTSDHIHIYTRRHMHLTCLGSFSSRPTPQRTKRSGCPTLLASARSASSQPFMNSTTAPRAASLFSRLAQINADLCTLCVTARLSWSVCLAPFSNQKFLRCKKWKLPAIGKNPTSKSLESYQRMENSANNQIIGLYNTQDISLNSSEQQASLLFWAIGQSLVDWLLP